MKTIQKETRATNETDQQQHYVASPVNIVETKDGYVLEAEMPGVNKEGLEIVSSPVSANQIGSIIDLISSGAISGKIAKDVFEIVWSEGGDPVDIVAQRGLKQVSDTGAIETVIDAIIAANPDKVAAVQAKPTMLGWFVGQVMKSTGGKANPQAVNVALKKKLGI